MKKNILRTVGLIALLILIFFSWLRYRSYQSYQIPIHKRATRLVKIHVDAIYKTLAMDFIGSPLHYLKAGEGEDKKEKKREKPKTGLKIPANILLYTLSLANDNTFFGYLEISDYESFKNFIENKFDIHSLEEKTVGIYSGSSKNGRILCVFTQKAVAFAFSFDKIDKSVKQTLMDILQGTNGLQADNPLLKKLKQADGHIAFVQQGSKGNIVFHDGNIALNTVFSGDSIAVPEKTSHKIFGEESSIKAWLNADISHLLNPKIFTLKNKSQLHTDSLLSYINGYTDFEMGKSTLQADSVVGFVYNDNFEKVPVKKLKEKRVPEIYISAKAQGERLVNYLLRQNILDKNLKLNKEIFPLYHFFGSKTSNSLQLSTVQKTAKPSVLAASNCFFYLKADFYRLRQQKHFPLLEKYTFFADSLIVSARKPTNQPVELKGNIYLGKKNINSLYQLMEQWPGFF